jgi:hypothetical protein
LWLVSFASVQHDQVNLHKACPNLPRDLFPRDAIGDIQRIGFGPKTGIQFSQDILRFGQIVMVDVKESQVHPLASAELGHRKTNTGCSASDQGGLLRLYDVTHGES